MVFSRNSWNEVHPKVMQQVALDSDHSHQIKRFLQSVPEQCKYGCLYYVIELTFLMLGNDPLITLLTNSLLLPEAKSKVDSSKNFYFTKVSILVDLFT